MNKKIFEQMMEFVSDTGKELNQDAKDFTLITPVRLYSPFLQAVAKESLGAQTPNPTQMIPCSDDNPSPLTMSSNKLILQAPLL